MKNYQISPGQIPHLVRLTADLFREMNNEINIGPQAKTNQMHFVADLLKDLVDTAYPMEEEGCCIGIDKATGEDYTGFTIIDSIPLNKESLDKAFEDIAKIMKNYKSPKAGEF